jgi:hypothetical protein
VNEAHRPGKRQNVGRGFLLAPEGRAETLARRRDDQFRNCPGTGENVGEGYRRPAKEKKITRDFIPRRKPLFGFASAAPAGTSCLQEASEAWNST